MAESVAIRDVASVGGDSAEVLCEFCCISGMAVRAKGAIGPKVPTKVSSLTFVLILSSSILDDEDVGLASEVRNFPVADPGAGGR